MDKNKVEIGTFFPEFSLRNQDGEMVTISPKDHKKRVIYFYPKNNTRKCTEEACSFRDWQDDFLEKGYEVIGISSDSTKSHIKFKVKYNLNFTLLSDPGGKVRSLFGASSFFGLIPSRKTFLINEKGEVLFIHEALFEGGEHVQKLLERI